MTSHVKPIKRWMRQYTQAGRRALTQYAPGWMRRTFGPPASYMDLLIVDHGIFRLFYQNRHRLGRRAWRSAQPAPHDIARLKRFGVRTVVNLRGESLLSSYWLEKAACERHGIAMEMCVLRSRATPTVEEIRSIRELFERIEYPVLMHCKSGADRAGLISVIYMHTIEGQPIEDAIKQLSLRYGHIRQADTGILDHFFAHYIRDNAEEPIEFYEWVETKYRPGEVRRTFEADGLASRFVNNILCRE